MHEICISTPCSFIGNHHDRCYRKSTGRISPPASRTSPAVIVMWYFAEIVYEYTKTVIVQHGLAVVSTYGKSQKSTLDSRLLESSSQVAQKRARIRLVMPQLLISHLVQPDSVHSMLHLSFQQAIVREKNRYGNPRVFFINRRMVLDLNFVSKHWQDSSGTHLSHRAPRLLYHFKSSSSFKALPKQ